MVKLMGVIVHEDKRDLLELPRDMVTIWVSHSTRAGRHLVESRWVKDSRDKKASDAS